MTEEEAKEQAAKNNLEGPTWFCPLINNTCNDRCLCFKEAFPVVWSKPDYKVMEMKCTNRMFKDGI